MRILRAASVCLFAFFFAILVARAQDQEPARESGTLTGTVHDESGAALQGVEIHILGESDATIYNDSDGHYEATELLPGSYDVTFSCDGFKTLQKHGVKVTNSGTTELDVKLVRDGGAGSPKAAYTNHLQTKLRR